MFRSWRGTSEAAIVTRPYMLFDREPDGRLKLYGYALPSRDRMETFVMRSPRGDSEAVRVRTSF